MSYSGGSFTYRSLGGVFATDPRLALGPDGYIHVSGQDSGGAVWVATGRPADNPFPAFRSLAGVFQLGINTATDSNGTLYLAGRDNFNSAWIGRWDRGVFFGWRFQGGSFSRDIEVATKGGTLFFASLDSGALYGPARSIARERTA